MFCVSSYCREWNPKPLAWLVPCFTCWVLGDRSYTLHYVMRGTEERLPCICNQSSWIKSKQGANQRSIITKANIQKALSVSALLRHPLPLQPPSLALLLPPSLHPTPSSSVQLPLTLPLLLPLPPDAFPPFHSLPFFPSIQLSFSVVLSSLHIVLHLRCPSYSYTNTYPPPPYTHTVPFTVVFFFNQPLTHVCLHPSLPLF